MAKQSLMAFYRAGGFDRVFALLREGWSVDRIFAEIPDLMSFASFYRLLRESKAAKRRYDAAIAASRKRTIGTERHFAAILKLVAGGLPLTKAIASNADFPDYNAFRAYLARHPDLQARFDETKRAAGRISGNRLSASVRMFDVIIRRIELGEPLVGICEDDGFPSRTTFRDYLADHPGKRAAYNAACEKRSKLFYAQVYTEDDYNRALLRFSTSDAPRRQTVMDGLPSYSMLCWRRRRDPEFAARYAQVIERRTRWSVKTASPSMADVSERVEKLVTRRLEVGLRAEIISDIVFDVLGGKLGIDQIAGAADSYVRRGKRQMAGYEFASLDKELFDDGSATLMDRLTTNDLQFWSM